MSAAISALRLAARRSRTAMSIMTAGAMTLGLAACPGGGGGGGGGITGRECTVSSVSLSPPVVELNIGATSQLAATPTTRNCTATPATTWASNNTTVATVSPTGLVTAVSPGTSVVGATIGGTSGTSTITVLPPAVATVEITPATRTLAVRQTLALSGVTRDANGGVLTGRTVTWTSSNTAVATVSSAGVLTAASTGSTTITATSEGRSAAAAFTIIPAPVTTVTVALNAASVQVGQVTQAIATLRDAAGLTLTERTVTWRSSNTNVATVNTFGVLTAVAPGTAIVTATSESREGSATLTVTQIPVASISLGVASASMRVGQSQSATASARDVNGASLPGRTVAWASSSPAIATVTQAGVITALSVGAVAITASSEGQFATAAISVAPGVASIDLTLTSTSITVAQTARATAVAKDAVNTTIPGIAFTFTSSNPAVATIDASGNIVALAAGTTQITVASGTITTTRTLTVTQIVVAVASLTMTPNVASLPVGDQQQLTATPRDAGGVALTGRTVTFVSANNVVAQVSAQGVVTGVSPGTTTVTARSEGRTAFATITVTQVPVATVTVSTPSTSVGTGTTLQATARLLGAAGQVLSRTVAWSSSNPALASVSAAGVITGVAVGNVTITAGAEGRTGSVAVTVVTGNLLTLQSLATTQDGNGRTYIESSIRLTFSDNVDPATVTASTVSLRASGVTVPATSSTSGRVVTIVPTNPLTEFNTAYQATVTTGVRATNGAALSGTGTVGLTTVMWDPAYAYRLHNVARGTNESLDTFSNTYGCFMGATGGFSGQAWYFTPIPGSGVYFTMRNAWGGDSYLLEGGGLPDACFMYVAQPGQFSGQMWRPVSVGSGRYRLQALSGGSAFSLGVTTVNGGQVPALYPTATTTSQYWQFVRWYKR